MVDFYGKLVDKYTTRGSYMGVEPKIGGFYPPKWMVKIMVPNPMNKWMIWGNFQPLFLGGNTHMGTLPETNIAHENPQVS